MNDNTRAVRATRVNRYEVLLTNRPVLASTLRVVDIADEKELVGWNIVSTGVRHLDAVCIEHHGELDVTDISLFDTNGPRRR